MKKIKNLLFLCFLCLAASCQAAKTDQPAFEELTQTTTRAAEITDGTVLSKDVEPATLTKTAAAHVLPTQTLTPPPTPTQTAPSWERIMPPFSMPLPSAKAAVEELLQTNGGCSLPCWWGIEPGKTSYTNAFDQFSPLSTFIYVKKYDENGSLDAEFQFPVPETNSSREFSIRFTVEKGIVQQIEVNPGTVRRFTFSQVLNDYGVPGEVWIEGIIDPTSNNPFWIFFYYPDKGISAVFDLDGLNLGETIKLCPGSELPTMLALWKPTSKDTFLDFAGKTNFLKYIKEEKRSLVPLHEVTPLSLTQIAARGCFSTSRKIWKAR